MTAGPDQTPILDVEDLSVDIPVAEGDLHAVCQVSFAVHREETFCLVGESGCGKSITALAVMDLLPLRARRNAKKLKFGGKELLGFKYRQMADIRGDRMAMIFQEPMTSLNPTYTIGNQMWRPSNVTARFHKTRPGTGPCFCWRKSASPPRPADWVIIPTNSPAACASGL